MKRSGVGGVKTAASILNFIDSASGSIITEAITEQDKSLAQSIHGSMFIFDNLIDIDDYGMQSILREVKSDMLILALKGADDTIKENIFSNMSERAAETMRDNLEAKGPVRSKDVEDAQKEILTVARRMVNDGEISLGGKGDDEYV